MRRIIAGLGLMVGLAGVTSQASAQQATMTVNYSVADVNSLSLSQSSISLALSSYNGSGNLTADTDNSTTYAIATNSSAWKLTAEIDQAMPSDLQLDVALQGPGGGSSSAGTVTLGTTAADVVTGGSSALSTSGKTVTYTLSAPSGNAAPTTGSVVVTFTLVPQ